MSGWRRSSSVRIASSPPAKMASSVPGLGQLARLHTTLPPAHPPMKAPWFEMMRKLSIRYVHLPRPPLFFLPQLAADDNYRIALSRFFFINPNCNEPDLSWPTIFLSPVNNNSVLLFSFFFFSCPSSGSLGFSLTVSLNQNDPNFLFLSPGGGDGNLNRYMAPDTILTAFRWFLISPPIVHSLSSFPSSFTYRVWCCHVT